MFDAITVSETVLKACPALRLGLLGAEVQIEASPEAFWQETESLLVEKAAWDNTLIHALPPLNAARRAYKALGQDPSRYRLSAEALHRRLSKGQGLYRINNCVDIINRVSLETGYSIGGYDLTKVLPPVHLERGQREMVYSALGRGLLNIEALPVLCDALGPFGNPSSDSERTCIGPETQHLGLVFFDFGGQAELEPALALCARLLQTWAQAQNLQTRIEKPQLN